MPENSYLENLMYALSLSENQAYNDALAIQNSILPDNAEFTADDATDWERRLGMIISPLVDLELRKLAIRRKNESSLETLKHVNIFCISRDNYERLDLMFTFMRIVFLMVASYYTRTLYST